MFSFSGTSENGNTITFTLVRKYDIDERFTLQMPFEFVGSMVDYGTGLVFNGNITKPENDTFGWIRMGKGLLLSVSFYVFFVCLLVFF